MNPTDRPGFLDPTDAFAPRHLGPSGSDLQEMLATLGVPTLDALIDAAVPDDIRLRQPLALPPPRGESQVLTDLRLLA